MNFNPTKLLTVPTGALRIAPLETRSETPLKFSLVLPTYNEGANIQKIVKILTDLLEPSISGEYELIVVDDNSPDRTWQLAQELLSDYPQLRVMRRIEEKGLSTAVIRGWQAARGEILGVIDADLQHPPRSIITALAGNGTGGRFSHC